VIIIALYTTNVKFLKEMVFFLKPARFSSTMRRMNRPLKILVCVKQVLSQDGPIEIDPSDPSGRSLFAGNLPLYALNRFDEFALEEALRVKDVFPATNLHALTVGPARAEAVLRRALGMGANHGIHLLTEEGGEPTPFQISSWIAAQTGTCAYDLILTGVLAEDDLEGLVGPLIAERLGLPCVASVVSFRVSPEQKRVEAEKEVEGGRREKWRLLLPAVLTIQSGINKPRYPSLSHVLRARKQALEIIAAALPGEEPRQSLVRYVLPEKIRSGLVLTGNPEEKADRLTRTLGEKGLLT
jgi:electron transfer flavoprotein beta subunit